jgi:hypothetical protein
MTECISQHGLRGWVPVVVVSLPGAEPVHIEVSATHFGRLSRQAARERTTIADLLRPTALAVLEDRLAHATE